MADSTAKLKQAVALSQAMLEAARQEKWDEIQPLQQQRNTLLGAVFPLDTDTATIEMQTLLRALLDYNQQTEQLCQSAKQHLQLQLSGLNKNKKAVAAYHAS